MTTRTDLRTLRTTLGALGKKPGQIWMLDNCTDGDGLYTLTEVGQDPVRLTAEEFDALEDDRDRLVIELVDAPEPEHAP